MTPTTPTIYGIEYLNAAGFWSVLQQSSDATAFQWRPWPTFASRDEAEAHIVEMLDIDPSWRGLRVTEIAKENAIVDAHRTTADTITNEQITALRREAGAAGDTAMVAVCDRALAGSARARRECARVIADAEAQQ